MYKLVGHSLTRGEWFEPESNPTILTERTSTATIVLGPDGPDISIDDWIWDTVPEGVIVWRVKSVRHMIDEKTRHVELEHVIQTLDDIYLFEPDPEPEEPGDEGEEEEEPEEITAREAVEYILSKQGVWTLGDFEYTVSNAYEFQKETLLDALENVSETLDDAVWSYDFSVFPFVLHIRKRNTAVACEMRGGRNLSTMQRTVNRGSMYTRFYPIGAGGLRLPGEYVSKNENLYSRRDKVETDSSKTTEESLLAWANGRLRRHCEPEVNITISGLELSAETGEALDQLKLNRVCRCPLPEFGTTIEEKITKLQWRDRKKEPEAVTVTLCNNVEDVATILRKEKRNGTSGKAGAEQSAQNGVYNKKNDRLWYEFFDECGHLHSSLEMTAASLRIDFDNLNNSTRSEFLMTAESMRIRFENEISSTRSEFLLTAESMRIRFENEITSTRSQITVTSQSLRSEFENTAQSLRSAITQEAGRISMVVEGYGESASVKRAAIILAINGEGGSTAHIDADQVYIGNEKSTTIINGKLDADSLTANLIQAKIETLATLNAANITANTITAGVNFVLPNGLYLSSNGVWQVQLSQSGNTYTLTEMKLNGDTREIGTFSKAITSASWAWSNGAPVVTLSPQGQSFTGDTVDGVYKRGDPSWASDYKSVRQDVRIDSEGGTTIKNDYIDIDTTAAYNAGSSAGYATGYAAVTVSAAGWVNGSNVVTASNGKSVTINLPTISLTGGTSFSSHKTTVYASGGGSSGYVASLEVDATSEYNSGSSAGYSSGYSTGYSAGRSDGYTAGYSAGKTDGYSDGYSAGHSAGYSSGKTAGWNECVDWCENNRWYPSYTTYWNAPSGGTALSGYWLRSSQYFTVSTVPSKK